LQHHGSTVGRGRGCEDHRVSEGGLRRWVYIHEGVRGLRRQVLQHSTQKLRFLLWPEAYGRSSPCGHFDGTSLQSACTTRAVEAERHCGHLRARRAMRRGRKACCTSSGAESRRTATATILSQRLPPAVHPRHALLETIRLPVAHATANPRCRILCPLLHSTQNNFAAVELRHLSKSLKNALVLNVFHQVLVTSNGAARPRARHVEIGTHLLPRISERPRAATAGIPAGATGAASSLAGYGNVAEEREHGAQVPTHRMGDARESVRPWLVQKDGCVITAFRTDTKAKHHEDALAPNQPETRTATL
jgi:hypothetical protein